ncbi:calcium-binding protein [Chachezhania sediminis]|uniref:hypothetical protein n=1 Tax=Chachezhania sediminis TaxID=2599291 RepID=UPI00131E5A7A|nr:hypothetical protein [Chachezhania sediminis]
MGTRAGARVLSGQGWPETDPQGVAAAIVPAVTVTVGAGVAVTSDAAPGGVVGRTGFAAGAEARAGDLVVVADAASGGLVSFHIENGIRVEVDRVGLAEGLGIAGPSALALASTTGAGGRTWAVLAAEGTGSLTVMELTDRGHLRPATQILDTAATRFAGVDDLSVEIAKGQVFVTATGDEGASRFALLPDGRLVHLDSGNGKVKAGAPDAAGLGRSLDGTGDAGRDVLKGGAKDDILVAGMGRDVLKGGAGDDILAAGTEGGARGARMFGGSGADTFVLVPRDKGRLVVADFEAGTDRLDLSGVAGLMDPDQLHVKSRAWGALIKTDGMVARIRGDDGRLHADDLFPDDGLGTPLGVPLPTAEDGLF